MAKTIVQINDLPTLSLSQNSSRIQELSLSQKLSRIQVEFKAKKGSYNKFGNYYYRSAESILEALKPFNQQYGVYFTINETLINANPPIMASVATIWDCDSSDSIDCQSIVGVDLEQKGMATAQRYGSSSSYGKKYALGNLLLIDDTSDADATNTHGKPQEAIKVDVKQTPYDEMKWLELNTTEFKKAKDYLIGGGDIKLIEKKYKLDANVKQELLNK